MIPPPPALILLVDDDRMDAELALDGFREARSAHVVRHVDSGQLALDYLYGRGEFDDRSAHPLPDLILLDLKMPGIDGFEVLRTVKMERRLRQLPVVVFTSSREDEDRMRSYDHGANSYLVKPTSFEGFVEVVKQVENYWLTLNVGPPPVAPTTG